jgi:hypothetical protein
VRETEISRVSSLLGTIARVSDPVIFMKLSNGVNYAQLSQCLSACSFAFIGSTIRGSSALRKDTVDSASGNLHNKQHINERPTMQQRTIKSANRHSLPRGDLRVDEDTFGCPTASRRVHN